MTESKIKCNTWKLAGSAKGSNSIGLPSKYSELLIVLLYNEWINYTVTLPAQALTTNTRRFATGAYHSSNSYTSTIFECTKNSIKCSYFSTEGVSHLGDVNIYVYYKD